MTTWTTTSKSSAPTWTATSKTVTVGLWNSATLPWQLALPWQTAAGGVNTTWTNITRS